MPLTFILHPSSPRGLRLLYKCINYFFGVQAGCFSIILNLLDRDCNKIWYTEAKKKAIAFLTMTYMFEWCCLWDFWFVWRGGETEWLKETAALRAWNSGHNVRERNTVPAPSSRICALCHIQVYKTEFSLNTWSFRINFIEVLFTHHEIH